jgi:hypothetical protein
VNSVIETPFDCVPAFTFLLFRHQGIPQQVRDKLKAGRKRKPERRSFIIASEGKTLLLPPSGSFGNTKHLKKLPG